MSKLLWFLVAVIGACAVGGIALQRGESINAMWIVVAAACIYALGFRFYSAWVAARVLSVDAARATPAVRLNDGRDFVPTNRWIVFGHHFAAIAGPGPLIGPTLDRVRGGRRWMVIAANALRALLADGGLVIVADEKVAETFTAPGDEIERLNFGFSWWHCLPASRAETPSVAAGTALRPATVRRWAEQAGFAELRELPVDHLFWRFYELRG